MTLFVVLGVGLVLVAAGNLGRAAGVGLLILSVSGLGGLVVASAVAVFVWAYRRARRRTTHDRSAGDGEILAIEGLSLATAAGMAFGSAAAKASDSYGVVGDAIELNLRRRTVGLSAASGVASVDSAFAAAQRSDITGAAVAPLLRGQLRELRRVRSEARRKAMARLPVKLLFPLVLLILPGFVLLAVVPTVMSGLSRLQI